LLLREIELGGAVSNPIRVPTISATRPAVTATEGRGRRYATSKRRAASKPRR
jgi:hypothetical protein